jgi:hypothetical protein
MERHSNELGWDVVRAARERRSSGFMIGELVLF